MSNIIKYESRFNHGINDQTSRQNFLVKEIFFAIRKVNGADFQRRFSIIKKLKKSFYKKNKIHFLIFKKM